MLSDSFVLLQLLFKISWMPRFSPSRGGVCKKEGQWSCFACRKHCATFPLSHGEAHICGETECKSCKEYIPPTADGRGQELARSHFCFIPKLKSKTYTYKGKYRVFAWDIECNLTPIEDTRPSLERKNLVEHVPSAVGCNEPQSIGGEDYDDDNYYRSWVGPDCMKYFWEWARQQGPATFLAHNGKAYDTLILMKMVQHEFTKQDHPLPYNKRKLGATAANR